jgi:hypothetical protein
VGTLEVTGTWVAKSNGSYDDKTKTKGKIAFTLAPDCLTVSKAPVECVDMKYAFTTLGWTDITCANNKGKCECSGGTEISGGLGTVPSFSSDGDYETSGSTLKVDTFTEYSYCVDGKKLTLTPKPGVLPLKGTIVLQSQGTGGTGGSSGGTTSGPGGSTTSSGGKAGNGGTSPGGTTSSGGKGGTGGTAPGGTTSSGGKGGTGGTSPGGTTGSAGQGGSASSPGGTTGSPGGAGGTSSTTTPPTGERPCDIFVASGLKCATAHSSVRALYSAYSGKLYRLKRDSDKTYLDILTSEPGGVADSSKQDSFCTGTKCYITRIWDQSPNGNYIDAETQDAEEVSARPKEGNNDMQPVNAMQESLTVGGKKVYAVYMKQRNAYWHDGSKTGMPLGKEPQGIYMVTSGKHSAPGCCFNYGNGPLGRVVTACGTIDAVNFSSNKMWDYGAGNGPWIMADFECGLAAGGKGNSKIPSMTMPYVTAIEKNKGSGDYVLRGGDAQKGTLTTFLTAKIPQGGGTLDKKGAVNLGSGGDCCYSNWTMSEGNFYEGAIVAGYPSDDVEDKVQANIVAAGYKEGAP